MTDMPPGFELLARVPCVCDADVRYACTRCGGSGLVEQSIPVTPEVYEFLTRGLTDHVAVAAPPTEADVKFAAGLFIHWKDRAARRGWSPDHARREGFYEAVEVLKAAGYGEEYPESDLMGQSCLRCYDGSSFHWFGLCVARVREIYDPSARAREIFESMPVAMREALAEANAEQTSELDEGRGGDGER